MSIRISDDILRSVEKPSRYTGNEWNEVNKDLESIKIRFAFCFPDVYEIGMSHLGMRILYHLLNERDDTFCERVFAPWVDMEEKMRENKIPLFSLETQDPIGGFDILGFTLQYEMSYTNILNMLNLADIPLKTDERNQEHPFICAGGPCAYNAEPLADIIDFFVLGEGEEVINEVLDEYSRWKDSGAAREVFLQNISSIEGIYVPQFYDVEYNQDCTIKSIKPISERYSLQIRKRIIKDMDSVYYPDKVIVPYTDIVHNRLMLELFRGCIRGCRFCQAGFIYRPVREKSAEKLLFQARKLEESTGYEEMSLASLSTSDYTELEGLTENLIAEMEKKNANISLPSLRVDSFSLELMEKAQKVRKSGLTFAPEAGTQRMRNVINKGITEEDIINSVSIAFNGGWSGVKLYFMLGLPTETIEDIEGIAALGSKVVNEYMNIPREKRGKGLRVTISTSSFIPKPFTPFQWEAQDTIEELREKQRHLRKEIKSKYINYTWHDPELSFLEAIFARGDRRIGQVLIRAWEKGCKFDSWDEHFKYKEWMEAFNELGIDPKFYANRKRSQDEIFPWDHIDIGVNKRFLATENKRAYNEEITENCRSNCAGCGAMTFGDSLCKK